MRREKKILQSIWEGKKCPAHQVARKKNLADRNFTVMAEHFRKSCGTIPRN